MPIESLGVGTLIDKLTYIERIDHLISIHENRRDALLREIEWRRAVVGEFLRLTMQTIEDRKIRANRENAQASTGPKTAQGRRRAAQKSFRLGLSLPVYSDPHFSKDVEALAQEIAGADTNAEIRGLAYRVAEAPIDLKRIRYARHHLLSGASSNPG